MTAFDPRPLTEPVDRAAVRAHAHATHGTGGGMSAGTVVGLVIGLTVAVVMGGFAVTMISVVLASGGGEGMLAIAGMPLLFVGAVVTLIVVLVVRGNASSRVRRYRLDRFARANAMTYVPKIGQPGLPGMIFGQGSDRTASDLLRGDVPRFVEIGNYRYTTGSGKNRTTHRWGYVAVRLDVPLPHIVLDAVGNNGLFGASNLPAQFHRDQRLSLEGDFDRFFSLYCPGGYEADALYLFTPDIMARFIDNAAQLDVEIVDDWLFLYAKRDLSTLDPATWAWLFSVVAALLGKLAQWGRWRDENLVDPWSARPATAPGTAMPTVASTVLRPPPGVAMPGRRLKRGVPWVAIIFVGGFALFWILSQLGVWGSFFGSLFGR